jgi:hypothetical protein
MRYFTFLSILLFPFPILAVGNIVIDTSLPDTEINSLYKQLVLDIPLTSGALQSATLSSDLSAKRYHITSVVGAPVFSADGVNLDGTTDYLVRTEQQWRGSDSLGSISIWFRTDDAGIRTMFGTCDTGTTTTFWRIRLNGGVFSLTQRENNDVFDTIEGTTTGLNDNAWHHVVVTSNGTRYKFYIDGVDEGTLTVDNGTNSGDWFADTGLVAPRDTFTVGVFQRSTDTHFWEDDLQSLKVWDRELSAAEVTDLYNKGRDGANIIVAP